LIGALFDRVRILALHALDECDAGRVVIADFFPGMQQMLGFSRSLESILLFKWRSVCLTDWEDVMEHKSLDKIRDVAEILPNWLNPRPLSKSERLERWAEALEREGGRQLNTLFQIEHAPAARRATLRADDSLLTVAFNDPHLRAEGLAGDTVGDAVAFFGISERQMHDIVCFCHHGPTIAANTAAAQIRAAATLRPVDARPLLIGAVVAASIAVGLLLI
jgi:hypothetical protein